MKNRYVFLIFFTLIFSCSSSGKYIVPWHGVQEPTDDLAKVYGGYAAGCFSGGEKLPEYGEGYHSVNSFRNRNHGHPELVEFIKEFGKKIKSEKDQHILVSDLSHPRGGPPASLSSHISHQSGLDVDIWFRTLKQGEKFRQDLYPTSVINKKKKKLSKKGWSDDKIDLLKIAASFDEVERILVNAHVKKRVCEKNKGEKWLSKIRPWWSHHQHFHVRLACPQGNYECKRQKLPPSYDGCDSSLDWWFSKEAADAAKESSAKERPYPNLPRQCKEVFEWENNKADSLATN